MLLKPFTTTTLPHENPFIATLDTIARAVRPLGSFTVLITHFYFWAFYSYGCNFFDTVYKLTFIINISITFSKNLLALYAITFPIFYNSIY